MSMPFELPPAGDELIWNIWMSRHYLPAISAAAEIGLWKRLGHHAVAADELASELAVDARALSVLLSLLCAMGLVVRREGTYRLTQTALIYLHPDSTFFWGPVLFGNASSNPVHVQLVERLSRPLTAAGQAPAGSPAAGWESGQMEVEQARRVAAFMHAHSLVPAITAARSAVFSGVRSLLDVGGGSGVFAICAAQRHPELSATIADLPAMCEAAQTFIKEGGVSGRVLTHPLDMWRETWPDEHDALFFSNIFHDWNAEQNAELARRAFEALPAGGRIILHEQLLDDTLDGPTVTASFSVLMLSENYGSQYSLPELRGLLEAAGFVDVTASPSCGFFSLLTASKP